MNKKIAFIICVNDLELYYQCQKYINNLNIPVGYSREIIKIENATNILRGYNMGMALTNAKFKVYLHQDVFIINKNFIFDVLDIFNDKSVGMIGVAGAERLPTSAVWWESKKCYGKVYDNSSGKIKALEFNEVKEKVKNVEVIDGLMMVTQYDLSWREDIFKGWHFYDISQSIEFKRIGHKVVIPKQDTPWCKHYCGIIDFNNDYEMSKNIFLQEYL